MAVNWVTQWWRAESEIDRLRAENDELRAQVEMQSRLIADLIKAQSKQTAEVGLLGLALDQAREAVDSLRDAIDLASEKVRL